LKLIPESVGPKILFATLVASVVTIPLSNNLNSIAVILFVAACVFQNTWLQIRQRLGSSRFWTLTVLFFLWYCATFFWDVSGGFTTKEIERYAILLFLPAACAVAPPIPARKIRQACMFFVVTIIIICLLCLLKAWLEYQTTGDYRVFYYQYLGEQMHLNAIFLSNYCLASITWLLYFSYVEKRAVKWPHHVITVVCCVFLLFMILLLSSKLVILLTVAIIVLFLLVLGYLRGFLVKALLALVLFIAAGLFAVSNLSYLRWRINTTEFKKYAGPQDDQNGVAIRLFMWETTGDLIEQRPILGYGIRGARQTLLDEYGARNFRLGVEGYYHSHNQYLESMLMAGIPALILLLSIIAAAIRQAVVSRNFLLFLMVSHFTIQSVFEATFEVQHELVFYMFFISLFYYHSPQDRVAINKKP
jgi:O-antigen ligase